MDALLSLVLGLIKSTTFVYFLSLIGRSLWPDSRTNTVVSGSAIAIFISWFAIHFGLPLTLVCPLILILVGLALLLKNPPLPLWSASLRPFLIDFAFFYTLAFLFTWPPVGDAVLPIIKIANTDILNYMNTASYLQRLGPDNIATLPYFNADNFIYAFTPGVHIGLGLMAALFKGDVMQTMMPFLFMVCGLIGCAWVRLSQTYFGLSRMAALGIAAILFTGPYFRYIMHFYFLSSLVGMSIFLYLLMAQGAVLIYLPFYFLLFYCYPPLFVLAMAAQLGMSLITKLSSMTPILISAGLVLLIDPHHSLEVMRWLSHITGPSLTGWPLDTISPLALLGLPSYLELNSIWAVLIGCSFFCILILRAPKTQPIMLLALLAILSFYAYALFIGPSYQQWKFGTYLALPLMFVIWALMAESIRPRFFIFLCMIIVCGNAIWHLTQDPVPDHYSAEYKKLRLLETLVGEQDIDISMSSFTSNYLPAYFIRNKTLHFMSPSSYPMEEHRPSHPYFIEGSPCQTALDSIGCLRYNSEIRQGRQNEY